MVEKQNATLFKGMQEMALGPEGLMLWVESKNTDEKVVLTNALLTWGSA